MKQASTRSHFRRLVADWLPLLFWMAVIVFMSHQPKSAIVDFADWDYLVKKSGHVLAYAVLTFLAFRALGSIRWAILWVLLFALSDELHQSFVPTRYGSPFDVLIDLVGVCLAVAAIVLWRQRRAVRLGRRGRIGGP